MITLEDFKDFIDSIDYDEVVSVERIPTLYLNNDGSEYYEIQYKIVTRKWIWSRNKYLMSEWRKLGFDSKFEYDVYMDSVKSRTEHHPERFKYTVERTYQPDFKIKKKKGKGHIYIETKGYWKASDRTKHLRVTSQNKNLDLRLVFMNANNRLSKNSDTTYAEWCDKHGVKWAEGRIPKEWFNE